MFQEVMTNDTDQNIMWDFWKRCLTDADSTRKGDVYPSAITFISWPVIHM